MGNIKSSHRFDELIAKVQELQENQSYKAIKNLYDDFIVAIDNEEEKNKALLKLGGLEFLTPMERLELLKPLESKELSEKDRLEFYIHLREIYGYTGDIEREGVYLDKLIKYIKKYFPEKLALLLDNLAVKSMYLQKLGQLEAALKLNDEVLEIAKSLKDYENYADILYKRLFILINLNKRELIDETFRKGLVEAPKGAEPNFWLGEYYRFAYQMIKLESEVVTSYEQVLEYLDKAEQYYKLDYGSEWESVIFYAMLQYERSLTYYYLGDYQESVFYAQKSLNLAVAKDFSFAAIVSRDLGYSLLALGKTEKAIPYFEQAVRIEEQKNKEIATPLLANIYQGMGNVYRDLDPQLSKEWYLKSKATFEASNTLKTHTYIDVLGALASLETEKNAIVETRKYLNFLLEQVGTKGYKSASGWKLFGMVCKKHKDYEQAINAFKEGAKALLPVGVEETLGLHQQLFTNYQTAWECVVELGHCNYELAKKETAKELANTYLEKAIYYYQNSFALLEENRKNHKAELSKLNLNDKVTMVSKNLMLALIEQAPEDLYEQLWQVMEQSKANLLQQEFANIEAQHYIKNPVVLEREKALKWALSGLEIKLEKKQSEIEKKELYNQYFEKRLEYQEFLKEVEKEYPDYHRTKYKTQLSTITSIQQTLGEGKKLLNYFLTEDHLFILLVAEEEVILVENTLPTDFKDKVNAFAQAIALLNENKVTDLSWELYNVLIRPIEIDLSELFAEGSTPLVIIPHGLISQLPFECLISNKKTKQALLDDFDISYHYSANLWVSQQEKEKEPKANNRIPFVGLAPVYEEKTTDENWVNLPFSEQEVTQIGTLLGNESLVLTHQQVSREQFLKVAPQAQYLHLAAHFHQDILPKLSGLILAAGERFYITEAFALNLSADLVVLSACESAVGELYHNEGMMAINRGFLTAGAENVISTLFHVNDLVATQLMILFYKNLLAGQKAVIALANAKRSVKTQKVPTKFWSAFVIFGK